jgi:hypothetical protein
MKKSIALLLILCFIVSPFLIIPQASAAGIYNVFGTVLDRHGNPIPNAEATLVNGDYMTLGTVKTDANGAYHFDKMPSSSYTFMVLVSYNDNGKIFKITQNDAFWCDGSQGILEIPSKWTTFTNYPAPEYGYLWGTVMGDGANNPPLGGAAVYASSSEQTYYTFSSSGTGAYEMLLPVGHYRVYAQYGENGYIYQTRPVDVDVIGSTTKAGNLLPITISRAAPTSNPTPAQIPGTFINTVNGTVAYKDGTGVANAAVSLWQSSDDTSGNYYKKSDTTTDSNGYYQFSDVKVTSDPPEIKTIYAMKTFWVSATYTDPDGNVRVKNQSFPLYNPNILLGMAGSEQSARNMTQNLQFDYSTLGWIQIKSDSSTPAGAKVFVDNQPWKGDDGKQLVTPCTAYIPAGSHKIRLSLNGYTDSEYAVNMAENVETDTLIGHLDKPMVPGWVIPAVAVLILLIVAGLIFAILASKRHMFIGPLSAVLAPVSRAADNFRASGAARKAQHEAQKAHAAETRKSDKARRAQMADSSLVSKPKIDSRRREQDSFHVSTEQARLPEHAGDDLSMVSARDIYRKAENPAIERVSHSQATGNMTKAPFGGRDVPQREPTFREHPITAEPDGRIRVPRAMPQVARDQPAVGLKDKERVIRYIREHGDGISFIQMSNELEIAPNTLTIITKELVINDDIEKVKGLYFYKTHDTSQDEGKSSVVVWRLDGED